MYIFIKVRKEDCTIPIPSSWFGRLCYEMIAPKVIVEEIDRYYEMGPETDNTLLVSRFMDEKNIWN